jgi:hypothetical protein
MEMPLPKLGEELVIYGAWGEQLAKVEAIYHWETLPDDDYFYVTGFFSKFFLSQENSPGFGWRRGGLYRKQPEDPSPIAKQETFPNPPTMVPVAELDALRRKLLLESAKIVGDFEKKVGELKEEGRIARASRDGWHQEADRSYLNEKFWREKCEEIQVNEGLILSKKNEEIEQLKTDKASLKSELEATTLYARSLFNRVYLNSFASSKEEIKRPIVGDLVYFRGSETDSWSSLREHVTSVFSDGFGAWGRFNRKFIDEGITWKW